MKPKVMKSLDCLILRKQFITETVFDQLKKHIPNLAFLTPSLCQLYSQLASGVHRVFISTKEAEYQDD